MKGRRYIESKRKERKGDIYLGVLRGRRGKGSYRTGGRKEGDKSVVKGIKEGGVTQNPSRPSPSPFPPSAAPGLEV